MRRLATTVLAVVGSDSDACIRSFLDAANVAVVRSDADDPLVRAQNSWGQTVRSHARYTMHDADPLAVVGRAWAAEFDGGDRGQLDVAVAEVLARWRADTVGLPDYYLVLDPDELEPALQNWYLGVLHRAAPNRVVPVAADASAVRDAIATLRAGRWWPELPVMLDDLSLALPDQLMVAAESALP